MKNLYTCEGKVVWTIGNIRAVTAISGAHLYGKYNSNVQSLFIQGQEDVKYIPLDIYKFFPNLEAIKMHKTGLTYVGQEHLYGLSKLRAVDFYMNQVKTLGSNLFAYQPNQIESISLTLNPVENIGYNVFSQMSKLRTVHFDYATKCFGGTCNNDCGCVSRMITQINYRCFPSYEMILEQRIDSVLKSNAELKSKLDSTAASCSSQGTRLTTLETNYNSLKSSYNTFFANTNNQLSSLSTIITNVDNKYASKITSLNTTIIQNYANLSTKYDGLSTSLGQLKSDVNAKITALTVANNAQFTKFDVDLTKIRQRQDTLESRIDRINLECCGATPFIA